MIILKPVFSFAIGDSFDGFQSRLLPSDFIIEFLYSLFILIRRLAKNLRTRKGSRRGNTANRLELLVLVHLHHVP